MPLGGGAQTSGSHYPADGDSHALLVLAHGAGAGQQHPFMVGMAEALAASGVGVFTFNFPYVEQRRRVPDRAPALESCFRDAVAAATAPPGVGRIPTFIGGKSMGGRMATHLAAEGVDGVSGVVVLGYPLHPPGKPDQLRIAHLPRISVPMLIIQGERDTFGTPSELAPHVAGVPATVTVQAIGGGDHSLAVRGRSPRETYRSVARDISQWMASVVQHRRDAR